MPLRAFQIPYRLSFFGAAVAAAFYQEGPYKALKGLIRPATIRVLQGAVTNKRRTLDRGQALEVLRSPLRSFIRPLRSL